MAAPVGAFERLFGLGQPVLPKTQHRELECCVGHSTLVRPLVRRRCAGNLSTVREQHAEVEGGGGVTATVRAREQLLGLGQPLLGCQPNAKLKRSFGIDALSAPRWVATGSVKRLQNPPERSHPSRAPLSRGSVSKPR